jgi:hypothetical protein
MGWALEVCRNAALREPTDLRGPHTLAESSRIVNSFDRKQSLVSALPHDNRRALLTRQRRIDYRPGFYATDLRQTEL